MSLQQLLSALTPHFGERLSLNSAIREAHGRDESWHTPMPPDAVIFAHSTNDVVRVIKACAEYRVPLIPFGVGTSLEGHITALHGGICLDMSQMNKILEVNVEDLDCRVEAGVTRKSLNNHIRDTGLFFPVDPGADATLGGMAATRASGTNAVRYGTMRENVLGLTAVMANGDVVRTSSRARKSSAGYDLTRLLVGSEGTLGIITEVALKLYGVPDTIIAGVAPFETLGGAVDAAIAAIQLGIPIARVELLDHIQIRACNAYAHLTLPEKPTLFVEFHGSAVCAADHVEQFRALLPDFGGSTLETAESTEARTKLWTARHNALYAAKALYPGRKALITDVCVPVSRLAECIVETQKDAASAGMLAPIAGHVGDGNFHMILLFDAAEPAQLKQAQNLHDRMVERALAMGGTCTGEHGVGEGKIHFLEKEHGAEAVALMRTIKQALDPLNILNPGKILRIRH